MSNYKWMPVEPTPEMISEGARYLQIMSLPEREAASVFRAMSAVAPVMQMEPVGYVDPEVLPLLGNGFKCLLMIANPTEQRSMPLYTDPQPAEQGDCLASQAMNACITYVVHGDADFSGQHEGLVRYFKEKVADIRASVAEQHPEPDVVQPVSVPEIIEAVANFVGSQKGGPFTPAVIKAAIIGQLEYGDAFTKLYTAPQPAPDISRLVEALEQIERWDGFPSTDEVREGSGEPVSYGAAFGSNGERDFMREVARKALAAYHKQGDE